MSKDGFSPGRTTTVTVDTPDYSLVQDPFWLTLQDLEITGNAETVGTSKVKYHHGIGFRLATVHDQMQLVHETDAGASVRQDIAGGLPSFAAAPLKGVPTLTGVPTGSQVAGDNFNQKQVAAGTDWSSGAYSLAADKAAYPSPTETEVVPLDRIYVGSSPMAPDQTLVFRFWVPHLGGGAAIGIIAKLLFTGLASSPNPATRVGTGEYALSLTGDGIAVLSEKLASSGAWVSRRTFRWAAVHQVSGLWHTIIIRSDAYMGDDGHWHGSVINFECQGTQDSSFVGLTALVMGLVTGNNVTQYVVPQTQTQHITQVPVRLECRRDLRAKLSVSFTTYLTPGTLRTLTFNCPRSLGAVDGIDPPFYITCSGSFPSGAPLDIALFGVDGTECTVASGAGTSGSTSEQTWKAFNRLTKADGSPQLEYYAVLTFHASSDLKHSATVRVVDVARDGAIGLGASVPFTVPTQAVTDYSIVGPSMDPTLETASIGLISLQDGFTTAVNGVDDPIAPLTTRSGQSVRIELSIPATTVNGHTATTSTLFLGKMSKLKRRRLGVKRNAAFPSKTWWQGKALLNGMWKRLLQAKTNRNFSQIDPTTNQLYWITKMISVLLGNTGLPATMLDVPDVPISLQADLNDKNAAFQIEVYSEAFGWALQLTRDYLGAAVVIDANATNGGGASDKNGCVRLLFPPRPAADGSYLPVCQFVDDATWNDGTIRGKLNLNSYAPYVRADGRSIPVCPVLGRTIENWDEAPEGNCVYVSGVAVATADGSFQQRSAVATPWAIIHNWPAANFYDGQPIPVDTSHQDYTDGTPNLIVVVDPSLNTQGAINICARRTFDLCCHRREYMRFEAPTVLVIGNDPHTGIGIDPLQVRPRPLRWGDCVLYQGKYWFVSNVILDVNGERGGTRNGSAVYELYRIPELMEITDPDSTVYQSFQLWGPTAGNAA